MLENPASWSRNLLPDAVALHARADELAHTVASHAPLTLRVTKEALRRLNLPLVIIVISLALTARS